MNYMFGNEECSSGCESGWTLYLEHSSVSPEACYDPEKDSSHRRRNRVFKDAKRSDDDDDDEDEDEDLSMVSDASSGPPHLQEEQGFYHYTITDEPSCRNNLTRKTKKRENRCRNKDLDHSSLLDDTASSPFLDFCNKTRSQPSVENVLEYSQGYSTTQFEVRPPYQPHYDYFQSSFSGNQLQQQNQWFEGKRW